MIEASVILGVRNGASTISDQLAALAAQDFAHPWELVVVDNGSTDGTVEVVRRWSSRFPELRVVTASERAGLAYARNVGAAASNGRILAFCDADDIADGRWLSALSAGARVADIVGGCLEIELLNAELARRWRAISDEDLRRPTALNYLHFAVGANCAVRREAFEGIGGCDEAFTICGDDVDLSWRIQRQGGALAYREDAIMHYRLRSDLGGLMRQQYLYGQVEGLLRRKFDGAVPPVRWRDRWPVYRALLVHAWHPLANRRRRGGWLVCASNCVGRISGALRYGVVNY